MIGESAGIPLYKTIDDVCTYKGFLGYLFGSMQGYVYRMKKTPHKIPGQKKNKTTNSNYKASNIGKAQFAGVHNCYVSMNTFFRTRHLKYYEGRTISHLKRLNTLYVDIDCYTVGLSKEHVMFCLNMFFIGKKFPTPTFIIDSGRGLYLIWKLANEDRNALPRWSAIQHYLINTLSKFGADANCSDAARVLRVPETINSNNNGVVKVLEFHDLVYTLYEFATEFSIDTTSSMKKKKFAAEHKSKSGHPYNHATERQRKYVLSIANKLKMPETALPDFTNFKETYQWIKTHKDAIEHVSGRNSESDKVVVHRSMKSILQGYCEDIETLFKNRKGTHCRREIGLFMYRYFLREMGYARDQALRKTLDLNSSLDCPHDQKYVIERTSSADRRIESGKVYAYKRTTIIEHLKITKDELEYLPHLSGKSAHSKAYRKEANRKAYERRLAADGKTAKKDALLRRRANILALQEQGKTSEEIQKALKISKATYYRDLSALESEGVQKAARALLETQSNADHRTADNANNAVKNGIVAITAAVIRNALLKAKNSLRNRQSHNFSTPFEGGTTKVVPSGYLPVIEIYIRLEFALIKAGDRGSGDESDGSAIYALCL